MYKQKTIPNEDIARSSFEFFIKLENKITIYPIRPIKETGIPKSVDKGPFVTASQFTTLLK